MPHKTVNSVVGFATILSEVPPMRSRVLIAVCCVCAVPVGIAHGQPSPYCDADIVFDNQLDFYDVSAFLTGLAQGDSLADFNTDGTLDFFDVSAFLVDFSRGCPDLQDSDADRLPDWAETDDGARLGVFATGTDPSNPDTDNDGLSDGDEILGTLGGLDLPALGADPLRKDIFIECDWYAGEFQGRQENYRPTPAVESRLATCFTYGSTPNPYGAPTGINMHLDYGQGGAFTGGERLPGEPVFITFDTDFYAIKAEHFADNRRGYFHYAIFANRFNSADNGSSGYAELNGDDLIITMVNFNSTGNMANTLVHELGHNLGLNHGGFEGLNYKPNYNSVMNYRYQFPGIDTNADARGDGYLDYSRDFNIDLHEHIVREAEGVNGFDAIDWNGNGIIDPAPYQANINCGAGIWRECGDASNCGDAGCSNLRDSDDWARLNLPAVSQSGDRQPARETIECENWPGKRP